jgi:type II secretory pathway pseudopilin PulG
MVKKIKNIQNNSGFTLLEVLFTIFIIIVSIVGIYQGLSYSIKHAKEVTEQFIANYLAGEGIEIVKNIRDTNWINGREWSSGLTGCSSGCEADFNDSALSSYTGKYLYLDSSNYFYQYDNISGEITPYQRKITITANGNNELDISVSVSWRGNTTVVKENIYNWK